MKSSMKWLVACLATFASATSFVIPARGQVAGSVEAGLEMLAQEIVEKSTAADRTTIAVLPFPHAEGSCSVLSTYIVDELILSLFSLPDSRLDIVERAQLEALLAEMKMGEGGLLNPETTKQLGNLSGVSASPWEPSPLSAIRSGSIPDWSRQTRGRQSPPLPSRFREPRP